MQDGWVLLFLWIFKRVGKRTLLYSGCWVTGPQWQEALLVKWQREGETESEREGWRRDRDMRVCGIWKELLLAVLDIYSFLTQWGVWRSRPAMFLMLQRGLGAFFCTCPSLESVWMREHILRPNLLLIEGNLFWDLIYNTIVNKLQVNR